jgi:SAM-dependent methyltransferase
MLTRARERVSEFTEDPAVASFQLGDARSFDLGQKFDAVISLFHVMSYQAGPGELQAALKCARQHLDLSGLFLFDFWYGPAVLAQKPERRERVAESARFHVKRTASPVIREDLHVVDVHYEFDVTNKETGSFRRIEEVHPMRYLMPNDVSEIGKDSGFTCVALHAWMSELQPDESSWSAFALLRASE